MERTGGRRSWAPLTIFVAWFALLLLVMYFPAALASIQPPWRSAVSNWDTGWYLSIVEGGYQTDLTVQSNVVFFPLYPLLVKALSWTGLEPVTAGVLLSLACFLGALFLLHRLLAKRLSPEVARNSLLLLAFWPFSFFFGLAYTESLFLLLAVAAFFFVDRERWWLAAACAGLSSATRSVGVFVAVAVLLGWFVQGGQLTRRNAVKIAGLGLTAVSGLVAFMVYLQLHVGDFLAFLHVQRHWPGRGEGVAGLRFVAQVLKDSNGATYDYAHVVIYGVPLVVFFALSLYVLLKMDSVWGCFSLLALLAPVPTGALTSTNRYVMVLFPCFAAAARLLGERSAAVVGASAGLLGFFTYHYVYQPGVFVG